MITVISGAGFAAAAGYGAWKAILAERMPELPEARRKRLVAEYQITMQDATRSGHAEYADHLRRPRGQAKSPRGC